MQPTESTPSTDVQEPAESVEAEEGSQETEDKDSRSWWSRLTRRLTGEPEPDSDPSDAEPPPSADQPPSRTMTEEEFQRSVQAEVDRREAKRQRDQQAAERKRLRDEDPWQYAEQDRQADEIAEQDQRLNEVLQSIGQVHDQATLVPLMQSLPNEEQQRLMALPGAGVGVDGRKLLTTEALKSLEKHWRAQGARDAEAKLRRNQAFRKQVMAELQGGYPEPELLPAGSSKDDTVDMNDIFRRQIGIHRTT